MITSQAPWHVPRPEHPAESPPAIHRKPIHGLTPTSTSIPRGRFPRLVAPTGHPNSAPRRGIAALALASSTRGRTAATLPVCPVAIPMLNSERTAKSVVVAGAEWPSPTVPHLPRRSSCSGRCFADERMFIHDDSRAGRQARRVTRRLARTNGCKACARSRGSSAPIARTAAFFRSLMR